MRLPFSPTISRVVPLSEKWSAQSRGEGSADQAHQEKSSICQKLVRGRIRLKKGIARMYMIIHPEGERRSAESRTPKVVAKLTDVLKLAVEDVDERLETVDGTEHDERGRGHGLALGSDEIDELWGASQSGVVGGQAELGDERSQCSRHYEGNVRIVKVTEAAMKAYVTGAIKVAMRSGVRFVSVTRPCCRGRDAPIMTMNRIEKQQNPQSLSTSNSSARLWIVELIHRRRWDMSTRQSSGAIVNALASRQTFILSSGNSCSGVSKGQRGT